MNITRTTGLSKTRVQVKSAPVPAQSSTATCHHKHDSADIGHHHHDATCRPLQLQLPAQVPQQQSPINLQESIFVEGHSRSLDIGWYTSEPMAVEPVHDHGRSAKALAQPKLPSINLDGKNFELQGFHFHTPSEHTVKNSSYPMELHLVHQNPEDGTRAVLGVFIDGKGHSESPDSTGMQAFLNDFETESSVNIQPSVLLPESTDQFYRYEGSLTTPGYDENVSWVVMKEPLHLAPDTLQELSQKFGHSAREVQPLNRRYVLSTFQD